METPGAEEPGGEEPQEPSGDEEIAIPPNLPRRGPLFVAFAAVTLCGILGGLIGYGLVDTSCVEKASLLERLLEQVRGYHPATHHCGVARASGSVVGAVLAALGAGVIAVLMLRAMAEWRFHHPEGGPQPG
ncbi:MAG TPA: hypothetical protein VH914_15475 [Acidimicrobiia bacterium]|nr:hypothetical protein [Acidimicrobiia bacterium]